MKYVLIMRATDETFTAFQDAAFDEISRGTPLRCQFSSASANASCAVVGQRGSRRCSASTAAIRADSIRQSATSASVRCYDASSGTWSDQHIRDVDHS